MKCNKQESFFLFVDPLRKFVFALQLDLDGRGLS